MTYSASSASEPSFWESEILDMLFSQVASLSPLQDAELVRQFRFVPGLKELVMLRQVHALEHATVWVLSSLTRAAIAPTDAPNSVDNESLSGMSTDRGFYLYGQVRSDDLSRAVQTALRRITTGNADLAVHPRCGTNLSVGVALTAGLIGASLLIPRAPIEQLLGIGCATITAAYLTPELGNLAQRYLTTAIPFNLAIADITAVRDSLGRAAHFVEVRWVE